MSFMTRMCMPLLALTLTLSCGGGGIPVPEGLETAAEGATDSTQTFQVQFSSDSASGIRSRLSTIFPDIADFIASGSEGREYMLQFFSGTPSFDRDITLVIYAEALRLMGGTSSVATLQEFLTDNISGKLIWTPHFVTHTIKSLLGHTDMEASGYYTAQQMQAAAAASTLALSLEPVIKHASNKPGCSRQYILVDSFNNPLTYVDSNGQTRPAVVHGTEYESNDVPNSVRDNYIEEVEVKGEGTYVTNDPTYPGEPSKQFNCAGYAFRSFNGNQRWNSSPDAMFEVLNGANLLFEVFESNAQPGDIVFYYAPGATASTLPSHVAEVNRIETGTFSNTVIVRNADGQSGLFDAAIDADYFTGNFFQAGRYPTRRIFRWVDGSPPSVIPDTSITGNGDYCGEEDDGGGSGDGSFSVTISIPGFSVFFNPDLILGANDAAATGDITINNVPTVIAIENPTSLAFDNFTLYFDPRQIDAPGDYVLRPLHQVLADQTGEAGIVFYGQDIKNVDDGTPVIFLSTGGTVSLTEYGENNGDKLVGTFSASISGDRVTGTDANGDPIESTITGTMNGSFNVEVL